ncbi:sensor histidine kinase [Paenibacillus thiaminolyticus]|uniref:histidine kinase n=1 Tax=Paenibacillus thiaminolyticus TaxID=49283 RepID=A0AAP9DWY7_PANTH|nr:sensor histidine kinase [Paenibacillus thiaminolyticus]MCY9535307.1 sensor histidine kinase [Paenibacillus thiaminolyticus]MCY9602568.1 sensor histidine kinase [Paenibacillus thiaminolyticus]MCY9606220.1 sensor histidine kinase [Paenibacillus thiaminolyticus]MCY9612605.1 sensor histidine kinase [Paenibacillus thiaminolyticus]MCY9620766.1 sensor histidine kinase [Paenibacillus thiaminolyticus]
MEQKKIRNFKESTRHLFRLYTIIPFVILIVLFFIFTIINGRMNLTQKTTEAAQSISQSMAEVFQQYYEEINRMAASPAVMNYMTTHLGSEHVYSEFYEFNSHQKVKSIFHIVDTNGIFRASTESPDALYASFAFGNLINRIHQRPDDTLTEMNSFRYSHDRDTSYTFGKAIVKDEQTIGYIVYQLYESDMQKLIFEQNNEIAMITDEHNTIIATTSNVTKGVLNKFSPKLDNQGHVLLHGGKYYMYSKRIPDTPIQVLTLNSYKSEHYTYYTVSVFVLAASLLLWVIIHFLSNKMSARNSESIEKLILALAQLREGNFNGYVDIQTNDEFEILGDEYNAMLDRLKDLMEKNKELSELRTIIEVKQLQSQFHPHFIFNVLETLRYAIKIDAKQAQEIVMLLSRLLRYSIGPDRSVQLKDDMNYVRDYLKLQQIRFNERLEYRISVAEEAQDVYVPKLVLQPIIENAIKYGYRNQTNVLIDIRIYPSAGKLMLEVCDNGQGMDEETLQKVNQLLQSQNNTTQHIGLYNVHRRLVLLYGDDSGIHIDSRQGKGTCVTLTIPYEWRDNDV